MRAYAQRAPNNPERDRLVGEHVDMARRIALRVARRVPDWMSPDDLVSAAMTGLIEAADRYDGTREEPFVAFAEKRIRGAVLDELRRGDMMPRRVRQTARKVGATIRQLEQRLGRAPEDTEIAAELGVSIETYRDELEMLTHVSFVDLSAREDRLEGETGAPDGEVERAQLVARLRQGLDALPERDAQILSLYYVEEFNYAEIGELLKVSVSRVCQLHARALARLRAEFEDVIESEED